nr:E3 ubiquitin-protein ligase MARCH3-like [Leptinotarsa decemlineata]
MYENSEEDLLEDRSSTMADIFEARKIHTLPLLSARSIAHANKLHVHSKDIFVSLLDSSSNSMAEYICRICHGGESLDDLLTPCRCRGTVALVHLKCLERWLKESNHSSCELCQHHYKIVREPQ